jgi:hypothetical protein
VSRFFTGDTSLPNYGGKQKIFPAEAGLSSWIPGLLQSEFTVPVK